MKKFPELLREFLARLKGPATPPEKFIPVLRCTFCGQPGHLAVDCPNAAKFHVFSVDHDAEDDGKEAP